MNKIRCMIIDDEPPSHEVIRSFVGEISWLEIAGTSYNAIEAMDLIQEKNPDLLFLDINMPKLSGIDLAHALEKTPMIIFITAYPEFAVEGFELEAVDYLVKPVAFERFIKAVNKARMVFEQKSKPDSILSSNRFIILKSDKKIYKVDESDILYIQSYGDYIKVYTNEKIIIAMATLKNLETELSGNFVRIHKSYIVSLDSINYLEGNQVKIRDQLLPVGQTYRENFLVKFNHPKI